MPSSKSARFVPSSSKLSASAASAASAASVLQQNVYKKSPIAIGLNIVILLIVLSYVLKVENNCNVCVNDTNLKSIKYMTVGFIIYDVLLLIFPGLSNIYLHMVIPVVYVIYLINIIIYVKKMNTHASCHNCAKDWRKTFMNVYSYIVIISLLLAVLWSVSIIILSFNK